MSAGTHGGESPGPMNWCELLDSKKKRSQIQKPGVSAQPASIPSSSTTVIVETQTHVSTYNPPKVIEGDSAYMVWRVRRGLQFLEVGGTVRRSERGFPGIISWMRVSCMISYRDHPDKGRVPIEGEVLSESWVFVRVLWWCFPGPALLFLQGAWWSHLCSCRW